MLAFAWRWPDAPIYLWAVLPVKAKYMVGILGLGALWATMQSGGGGCGVAHWAHLGGLVTGFVVLKYGESIAARWRRMRGRKGPGSDSGASYSIGQGRRKAPRDDARHDDFDEVDRILDKIREEGMDALSAKEREFLETMSKKYRSRPDATA